MPYNASIDVVVSDITELEVDAIVNPTNTKLLPGGGIPTQILRKGGSVIQVQCNAIINKITTLPIGSSVITTGGKLKALNVIHTACPYKSLGNEKNKLRLCTINSLKLLDKHNLKSIAFPLISIGLHAFTVEQSATIMLNSIKEYLQTNSTVEKIIFCLEDDDTYKEFEKVILNFEF